MQKNSSPILLLTLILLLTFPSHQAFGQNQEPEKFTTIGPIGISNKYKIPENRRAIIFKIKNYASRSINQIFGRVFMIDKKETDPAKRFLLINNPHKGGSIIKGKPHRPGTVSEWIFVLARKPLKANQNIDYTLQIHPRSIFYVNVEPSRKSKEITGNP